MYDATAAYPDTRHEPETALRAGTRGIDSAASTQADLITKLFEAVDHLERRLVPLSVLMPSGILRDSVAAQPAGSPLAIHIESQNDRLRALEARVRALAEGVDHG